MLHYYVIIPIAQSLIYHYCHMFHWKILLCYNGIVNQYSSFHISNQCDRYFMYLTLCRVHSCPLAHPMVADDGSTDVPGQSSH